MDRKQLLIDMGKRLKLCRLELGLTQEKMAELMNISLTYYGQIERGLNGLSLEKLLFLYSKYGIEPNYLITGNKSKEIDVSKIMKECPSDKRNQIKELLSYAYNVVNDSSTK